MKQVASAMEEALSGRELSACAGVEPSPADAADGSTYIALKLVFESIIMPPLWNSLW